MDDTITLKRIVTGEFAPQFWVMTGGTFDALLSAVQSLPVRQYQSLDKVWQVRYEGIVALREAGYTVKLDSDVRVILPLGQQSIQKNETSADVEIVLDYRRKSGEWASAPSLSPRFSKNVHLDFTSSEIEKIATQVQSDELVQKHISEKNMQSYCHESAILTLASRAVFALNEKAEMCYKEHKGKRSQDEYKAALEKVWSEL